MPSDLSFPSAADGSLAESSRLLRRLDAWPFLRIERHGRHALLYGGHRDRPIGTVDVRSGMLTVDVAPDLVGSVLERHPRLRVTDGGLRLGVTDAESRAAAEALVRWRIGLDRFASQLRAASP